MHTCRCILISLITLSCIIASGCTTSAPPVAALPAASQPGAVTMQPSGPAPALSLQVDSLTPGSPLPDAYSCKGASESPAVSWDGIPAGTKSLVLILDDPDAPKGTFTHWIVFNIPPQSGGLARAQPNLKVLSDGAQQGDTSSGSRGYYPPCPPVGTTHRYIFRLYAVDMDITQPAADRESIDWALTGHTLAETAFTTTLKR